MTTGLNKCPICMKNKSCNKFSFLRINTNRLTYITKTPIYDYVCMDCCKKIRKIENLKDLLEVD